MSRYFNCNIARLLLLVFVSTTCSEEGEEKRPAPVLEMVTDEISLITATSAVGGGTIVDDTGLPVLTRGVCWSTNALPTIDNDKTSDGTGDGTFISTMTELTPATTYFVRAYAITQNETIYASSVSFKTIPLDLPTVITLPITDISTVEARSGGNVTSDGGAEVVSRGVCWSSNSYPTINNNKSTDGIGIGTFNSQITGLTGFSTYYVRAYATNEVGTSYGEELIFHTFQTGSLYQGGIIGYILKDGDPGYDPNVPHGLIVAPTDQSTSAPWGCYSAYPGFDYITLVGADGTAIGTGYQNTLDIIAGLWPPFSPCTQEGIAARLCYELVLNNYDDWFLPSIDELFKLYYNRTIIANAGGAFTPNYYWSSSEGSSNIHIASSLRFTDFYVWLGDLTKNTHHVRAIRYF